MEGESAREGCELCILRIDLQLADSGYNNKFVVKKVINWFENIVQQLSLAVKTFDSAQDFSDLIESG